MATKKKAISFRAELKLVAAIRKRADEERTTMSAIITTILLEAFQLNSEYDPIRTQSIIVSTEDSLMERLKREIKEELREELKGPS